MSGSGQAGDSKPFVCSICQKSFATKQSNDDHVLVVHQVCLRPNELNVEPFAQV